jgi:hypothetical protein
MAPDPRTQRRRRGPLDLDLTWALRTVRLVFGDDQVTVLSLIPCTEAERVEGDLASPDAVAGQVLPYVQACLDLDREELAHQEGQP